MQIHYLEIVTKEVDAVCAAYAGAHSVQFGKPDAGLGNARTAGLPGGGLVGVRAPMHEGRIVDALRANGGAQLSLVAVDEGRVVGHIMYSPLQIGRVEGSALGPMAVDPEVQRQGIGTELVEAGDGRLRQSGCPFVVVVGHSEFYPRFGFKPARPLGITCEWEVPDDVFMILVLDETTMSGLTGKAVYRPEFSEVA